MKKPKLIPYVLLIAAIAIAIVLLRGRQSRPTEPATVPSEPAALMAQPSPAPPKPLVSHLSPPASAAPSQPAVAQPNVGVEPVELTRVRTDQVLTTVNNQSIQLKDLLALAPDDAEKTMTAEEYHSRLNRAIEVELTFQAAQAEEVGLTAEQQKRLNRIARDHEARLREHKQQGISWSSVTTAQLEFEKRLMSALMLQQNLVAKEAAVAPSPDMSVQARFEQVSRDMLGRLKASATISSSTPAL